MELIYLGALGFWVVIGISFIIMLALIENERPGWATFNLIVLACILQFLTNVKVFDWVKANPLWTVSLLVGYLIAGSLWSIAKWAFFVYAQRRKFDALKADFLRYHKVTDGKIPDELREDWLGRINYNDFPPRAVSNKARIMTWMIYWPWSLLWTVIDDPVKRAFTWVFDNIREVMESISKRAFRGTENDLNRWKGP